MPWLGDAQLNVLRELGTLSEPREPFSETYCWVLSFLKEGSGWSWYVFMPSLVSSFTLCLHHLEVSFQDRLGGWRLFKISKSCALYFTYIMVYNGYGVRSTHTLVN